MMYLIQARKKGQKKVNRIQGWWRNEESMVRQLEEKGWVIISWMKI